MADKRIYVNHDLKDNVAIGFGTATPTFSTARLQILDKTAGAASTIATIRRSDNSLHTVIGTGGIGDAFHSLYDRTGSLKIQLHANSPSYINTGTGLAIGSTTTIGKGKLTVTGAGTTTATKNLLTESSAGTDLFYVDDAGRVTALISGYYTQHGQFAHQPLNQFNTALGYLSAPSVTQSSNVAVGSYSMWNSTSATQNVAVGHGSLQSNTTGDNNTAIGYNALRLSTVSGNNTAIGISALSTATTIVGSVAVGGNSLENIVDSQYNVAVGYNTGLTSPTTIDHSIMIGYEASALQNNTAVIGGTSASGGGLNRVYFGKSQEEASTANLTGLIRMQTTDLEAGTTDGGNDFDFHIAGGKGTGTGDGSDLVFETAIPGTTGSTQNAHVEAMRISGNDSSITFSGIPIFPAYTVATLPAAAAANTNGIVIVTDEVGGRTICTSDGSNWRRVSDGAGVA